MKARVSIAVSVVLIAALSRPATSSCTNVVFDSAPWFTGGGFTTSLAAADFNGDGHIDLAVASGGGHGVDGRAPGLKIFLNDGQAHFSAAITVSDTLYVRGVQAADFDGDRLPDLLVTEEDTNDLIVLANRNGNFSEVARYPSDGSRPAIGDFNGDGHLDVAVRTSSGLIVLVGDGRGAFTSTAIADPAGVSGPIGASDLDRDGRDDLVETDPAAHQLVIRAGDASATLGQPQRTAKFQRTTDSFLIGDFDGSGKPDIATFAAGLTVLELLRDPGTTGRGTPVFQAFWESATVAGDFTGDGITDLAGTGSEHITVDVLDTNSGFKPLSRAYFAIKGGLTAAADFDGDGTLDLAVANQTAVTIVLNQGGGRFVAPPHIGARGVLAVVDLNGDGVNDLITDGNPVIPGDFEPIVWFGNADGTYRPGGVYSPNPGYRSLVQVADVNRDSNPDVIVVARNFDGTGELLILFGNPGGMYETRDLGRLGREPGSLAVVDLDRDGNPDIIVGNGTLGNGPVTVLYGRGDGSFDPPVDMTGVSGSSGGPAMRVGDLNADGLVDIVAGGSAFINLGQRTFRATPMNVVASEPSRLADMNGDGKTDLIWATEAFSNVNVRVALGHGDGTFSPPITTAVPPLYAPASLDIADFDGDGRTDIVVNDYGTTSSTNTFAVLYGTGDGHFENIARYWSTGLLAVVDLNGDGRPDIMNDDVLRLNSCADIPPRHRAAR